MAVECHTVRFYQLDPKAIHCMKCEQNLKLLALARCDSSLEVWNLKHTPFLERAMMGSGGSIEGLAWFNKRLFSVGLQGSIIEYDLYKQSPKSMHPLTSGASWCISVHQERKQLAAGTEDGFINLFDITEDEVVYNKIMDKQEGRIVCLDWESKGEFLVSGSADTVRVWNVATGHAVHRMLTGRATAAAETIVWTISVTSDFTIISGDSRGKLCFWDGRTGTIISSYQSHKAAILALTLSEDENIVYCAGVDPLIATYEKVKIRDKDERGKWVKSIQRVIHDHEVKALAICDKRLFSAGIDSYLALSSYPPKLLVRYPPLLQGSSVSVGDHCVLLRYHETLEIWRLRSSGGSHSAAELVAWKASDRIKCAALSPDSCWIACSTMARFTLVSTNLKGESPCLTKVKVKGGVHAHSLTSHAVAFSSDSRVLACASLDGLIYTVELGSSEGQPSAKVKHVFNPRKCVEMVDSIHLLAVSKDGTYVVSADLNSNIIVWSNNKMHSVLPRYNYVPTAISVQPETDTLVAVFSDHKIVEYSLSNSKFTKFSQDLSDNHPKQWLHRSFPVRSIMFDSRNSNIIALHDDSTILVINKQKELPVATVKIPRLDTPHSNENSESGFQHPTVSKIPKHAFHVVKKYKHLVYVGSMKEGEIVAVELSPVFLRDKLPPAVKNNKFGQM